MLVFRDHDPLVLVLTSQEKPFSYIWPVEPCHLMKSHHIHAATQLWALTAWGFLQCSTSHTPPPKESWWREDAEEVMSTRENGLQENKWNRSGGLFREAAQTALASIVRKYRNILLNMSE